VANTDKVLLPFDDPGRISWQGAVGASGYDVERASKQNGPWTRIAYSITDSETAHRPLYHDQEAAIGSVYYYRVRSRNEAGLSAPSNVVGPVTVPHRTLVDECWNFAIAFSRKGDLAMQTDHSRAFKEDAHRLAGKPGAHLVYYVTGALQAVKLYVFAKATEQIIQVSASGNGMDFTPLPIDGKSFYSGPADYDYWRPILYRSEALPAGVRFIKITFLQEAQLGRAELIYGQ